MSRGYGKSYRKGTVHTNFQFDNLFKENANRPSASRSAGTVGKWGITSFTSIRTANGLSRNDEVTTTKPVEQKKQASVPKTTTPVAYSITAETVAESNTAKPKKFFKSRNVDAGDGSRSDASNYGEKADYTYNAPAKRSKVNATSEAKTVSKPKKFFSSKNAKTDTETSAQSTKKNEAKPPIVLRICRGKSQLLSDSDESESTPTPSSAPVNTTITSPRATRDNQRSPGHTRVTRSTRRSLQQDPSNSPATAESPTDTFSALFMSPKKGSDLSPVYIPAEKYELERKAMYDNLLRPNSPTDSASTSIDTTQITESVTKLEEGEQEEEVEHKKNEETEEENGNDPTEDFSKQEPVPEPMDTSLLNEEKDQVKFQQVEDLLKETNVDFNVTKTKLLSEPTKTDIQQDWTSDSESDESIIPEKEKIPKQEQQKTKNFPIEAHKEEILEKILEKPITENPSVKLVISKKKGSIFKSRSLVSDGSKKRRYEYKHKWCDDKDAAQKGTNESPDEKKSESQTSAYDDMFDFEGDPLTRVQRENEDENDSITSVKCTKRDKDYYTVVRNVKKAHQMQEIGEFQEFNDDVEYILDALQDTKPNNTRCLSAITLASKCMAPAFRMHVRAHGTVAKFFKALHDATKDQSLGLCTATVMFVLSQDRLNMDLDRDCLELMLNLLESDVTYQQALKVCGLSSAQFHKNKQKVRELCAEIQSQGHAMHLNLDNITVGQLAMETLLSLTSKRAGEWFKEELRELGGLEHIMKTICECCRQLSDYVTTWTDALLDKLRKIDRCMRVLENVTYNNEENQTYLLKYNNGIILDTLVKLYRLCDAELPLYPVADITDKDSTGTVIREALLVTLKVLINLTHHFNKRSDGSSLVGARPGIIDASLHLLLQVPHYIPDQKKFELGVLVLMLLINLIQENDANKKLLIEAKAPADFESIFPCDKTAVEALIVQFYTWEECARLAEKKTDAILDGEKDSEEVAVQPKTNEEFIEETVAKLLQKAGTHMEFTLLASYIVLLVGFLIMDNEDYQKVVRQFLKGQNFSDMVELLKKFFNFMNLTASTEASSLYAVKATERVIKFLEKCDEPPERNHSTSVPYTPGSMDLDFT